MMTVLNYCYAFWTVVVMNCIQPVNWEYCLPVHEWLLPEVHEGFLLITKQKHPYQEEKEYLKNLN